MNLKQYKPVPVSDGVRDLWRRLTKENYKEIESALKSCKKLWDRLAAGFKANVEYDKDNDKLSCECFALGGKDIQQLCCVISFSFEGKTEIKNNLEGVNIKESVSRAYKDQPSKRTEFQKLLKLLLAYDRNKDKIFSKFKQLCKGVEDKLISSEQVQGLEDSRRAAVGLILRLADSSEKTKALSKKYKVVDSVVKFAQFVEDWEIDPLDAVKELDNFMTKDEKLDFIEAFVDSKENLPESLSNSLQDMITNKEATAEEIIQALEDYWSDSEKSMAMSHLMVKFD